MIIVKLQGGLGNQMFQYAFGKTLSKKKHDILLFDSSFYQSEQKLKTDFKRNIELNLFNVEIYFATKEQIKNLLEPSPYKRILKAMGFNTKAVYKQISLAFNTKFDMPGHIYFDGYWQSEQYFKKNIAEIRKEFIFKDSLNQHSEQIKNEMLKKKNSVSIHIRRSDYITSPHINKIHGISSPEYYQEAISYIEKAIVDPFFYLFSDDPGWVSKNFLSKLDNYYLVNHNQGLESWQDMALMSLCNHHIIANSTFSWWGAWLNPSPEKIVIAPKKWFADPILNDQSKSLIPENWIRL